MGLQYIRHQIVWDLAEDLAEDVLENVVKMLRNPACLALWTLCLSLSAACGDEDATPAEQAPAGDPRFQLDKLDGRWIMFDQRANQKFRFEWHRSGSEVELWYTNGGFTKRRLAGELRPSDWRFTELLSADEEAKWKAGDRARTRLFVAPRPEAGALRVTEVSVEWKDGKEVEKAKGKFKEYVPFPEGQPFTFRPCDGPLFLGAAASSAAAAEKQLAEEGAPFPGHPLGEAIVVGVYTDAAADGDAACTFDMDLFFDDRPADDKSGVKQVKIPAGEVTDGKRAWVVSAWYAPYSGNHHFQMYRYRSCGPEGARELLGVQCIEAVLE